jgi:photosystem II stability/assembly factor-like uncharacterized protein
MRSKRVTSTGLAVAVCMACFLFVLIQDIQGNPILTPGVWKDISPSRGSSEVWYVRVDPGNPNTIYACTGGDGLFKSTNAGSIWSQINVCPYIAGLEIDPKNSQHLYVGGWQNGDFWESLDGGATWTKKPLIGSPDVGGWAVDPSDFRHIILSWHYIFDGNGTFCESKDGGNTWNSITIPGVQGASTKGMHFLYQPELKIGDNRTWLVTGEGSGFWRTSDAGATWTNVAPGITGTHGGLKTTYYTKEGVLYLGGNPCPVRSTDNGITWERICGNLNNNYYASLIGDGKKLYLGADYPSSALFTSSENDGKTWQAGTQIFSPGPGDLAFDSVNRILYLAQRKPGLYALKIIDPTTSVVMGKPIKRNTASTRMSVVPVGTMRFVPESRGVAYDIRGKLVDRNKIGRQLVILNPRSGGSFPASRR